MALTDDLISQFVKITKDEPQSKKEDTVYGTVVIDGGKEFVQLDGSNMITPISSTTVVNDGDRVLVTIKNHSAIVTGNISSPSANNNTVVNIGNKVDNVADQITEFEIVVADKVSTKDFDAEKARIDTLTADNVTIKESLTATQANVNELTADNVTIKEKLTAAEADIDDITATMLTAEVADINYAKIKDLEATNATVNNLNANYGEFNKATVNRLNAAEADIDNLTANKLDATTASITYANIDFSNIGEAAIEKVFSESGIIKDLVVSEGNITGELVGVTIKGDLIEGGTVVADKLVVKGSNGLYYKLNTDGVTTEAQQTEYNSLNGSVIAAKSITATKITVDDLVAFDATIGGFNITDSALYSGVKSAVGNTTSGVYLDKTGQMAIGNGTRYVRFYKDASGNFKLIISADSITFGSNNQNIETVINGINTNVGDIQTAVQTAQSAAEAAQEVADTAKANAATAQSTADTAKTNAANAQKAADQAQADADAAQEAADKAQADVDAIAVRVTTAETKITQNEEQIGLMATKTEVTETLSGYYTKEQADAALTVKANEITSSVSNTYATKTALNTTNSNVTTAQNTANAAKTAAENAQNDIDNLEIGGRNLIRNSNFKSNGDYWAFVNLTTGFSSDTTFDSYLTFTSTSAGSSNYRLYADTSTNFTHASTGITYTLSFYAKASASTTIQTNVGGSSSVNASNHSLTTSWQKFTKTYTTTSTGSLTFWANTANVTIYLTNIKLELGNKPTDWTPAPEDVDDTIEDAQSSADAAQADADNAGTIATAAQSQIKQLAESISSLVTDASGGSLMTQTSTGWTFNIGSIMNQINQANTDISTANGKINTSQADITSIKNTLSGLNSKLAYINVTTTSDGQPCMEWGMADSIYKIRITNTDIQFVSGSNVPADIDSEQMNIDKVNVKEELIQGKWSWKVRANGNLGLQWNG